MARMIPGRVRSEGIKLYEQGLVTLLKEADELIDAEVAGVTIRYALDDNLIACPCDFFGEKNYCVHLAAVEHALHREGYFKQRQDLSSKVEQIEQAKSFGSIFLERLAKSEEEKPSYRLSVRGQFSPYSADIWWTLRINRLPDKRSYIIRDIRSFLSTVKKEIGYQINKQYFEILSLPRFDQASQELILFLWQILPKASQVIMEFYLPNQGRHLSLFGSYFEKGLGLFQALHEFSFEDGGIEYTNIDIKELTAEQGLYQFQVLDNQAGIELRIEEKSRSLFFDNHYLWYQGVFYRLNFRQMRLINAFKSLPLQEDSQRTLQFLAEEKGQVAAALEDFQVLGQVDAPPSFIVRDFVPSFDLDVTKDQRILLSMSFDYGTDIVSSEEEWRALPYTSHFQREEKIFQTLKAHGFQGGFTAYHPPLRKNSIRQFFKETLPVLRGLGLVRLSEQLASLQVTEQPLISISHSGGLLEISFDFSQVYEADVAQAMAALEANKPDFITQDGRLIVFDEETQRISETLQRLKITRAQDNQFLLANTGSYHLSQVAEGMSSVHLSQSFEQLAYDLTHPDAFKLENLAVQADLRDYQMTGVKWFSMLDYYGFGGILADDMGLGKTLQTIAFLSSKLTPESKVLVLAPSSLIYNWQDEFAKFAPQLDVVVAYGSKPARDQLIADNHQVTITSYASFRQDFDLYQAYTFDYLILDEAQVMKNSQSKISQHLRQFSVKSCFALSGTPIENKLQEIWSIFQVVLPGLLPGQLQFSKMSPNLVARYIAPFIMRRKKEDVLPELPDLQEMVYQNELADEQKAIYLAQLRQMQERVEKTSLQEFQSQRMDILSGIMRLRQICDTPALFIPTYQGSSGKLESLRQLLQQLKDSGKRALIFSQFRGMLDIVEEELTDLELTSYKITGSTPAASRQEMTRSFNEGEKDFFLISLKAGGVGLNLTGADSVVLIDLWWNPAVEMQAIGRAHRLGQERRVEVYRLITRGTIEEKILALQENKKHLISTVLDGKDSRSSLTLEEIKQILGLS